MSRVYITSDLHLGHKNACKWRPFDSSEEHDGIIWDNLCSTINKRDSIIFLGDVAFTTEWLDKIKDLKVRNKVLILGNHDTDNYECSLKLFDTYDKVHSMMNYKGTLLSHCPIHKSEFRGSILNVHGHLHQRRVMKVLSEIEYDSEEEHVDYAYVTKKELINKRYFNVCLEHTEYEPIDFQKIKDYIEDVGL